MVIVSSLQLYSHSGAKTKTEIERIILIYKMFQLLKGFHAQSIDYNDLP